jgi:hypothetical protein
VLVKAAPRHHFLEVGLARESETQVRSGAQSLEALARNFGTVGICAR